ncbi:hypothetical protein GCM10009827_112860 [Dactylosporangium maewongense]|uniref:Uncharacterized protein n=1 Tax=Dactylosporangium maewongense TaxID=634393 RepID=A0ABN2D7Z0_9ACTN
MRVPHTDQHDSGDRPADPPAREGRGAGGPDHAVRLRPKWIGAALVLLTATDPPHLVKASGIDPGTPASPHREPGPRAPVRRSVTRAERLGPPSRPLRVGAPRRGWSRGEN